MARRIVSLLVLLALLPAACSDPEKAWEQAEREDSNQAYLEFLAKYPQGEYADRARRRIAELKIERAWERAQFRDRIEHYRRFLEQYPDSQYAAAARERIAALERDAAWAAAADSEDIEALEAFLARYPDAPQAAAARELIAGLTPPEPAVPAVPLERPGDFRLQLGAFRTAAAAEQEVRRLVALYGERLLGPIRIYTPVETGSRWFLLRSAPLSRSEAESLCAELQADGQSCFLVNRD